MLKETQDCWVCKGEGKIVAHELHLSHYERAVVHECPACGGSGRVADEDMTPEHGAWSSSRYH